jgi:Uma2 family endonuclease
MDYRKIDTLEEYILVNQDAPHIERYLRQPSGEWLLTDAIGLQTTLYLPSIQCSLALAEVYERLTLRS